MLTSFERDLIRTVFQHRLPSHASVTTQRSALAQETVTTHNAITHVFYEAALEAGLLSEKAGLLEHRPNTDRLPQRASLDSSADVMALTEGASQKPGTSGSPPAFTGDGAQSEPDKIRDTQEDVPRHRQQMPSERPPFHTCGF